MQNTGVNIEQELVWYRSQIIRLKYLLSLTDNTEEEKKKYNLEYQEALRLVNLYTCQMQKMNKVK